MKGLISWLPFLMPVFVVTLIFFSFLFLSRGSSTASRRKKKMRNNSSPTPQSQSQWVKYPRWQFWRWWVFYPSSPFTPTWYKRMTTCNPLRNSMQVRFAIENWIMMATILFMLYMGFPGLRGYYVLPPSEAVSAIVGILILAPLGAGWAGRTIMVNRLRAPLRFIVVVTLGVVLWKIIF